MKSSASPRFRERVTSALDSLRQSDTQLSLFLSLILGALVGLVIVAFILLTGRLSARMYPPGGSGLRRILVPFAGSLAGGFLLFRYFPQARGSGIPQTRAALLLGEGRISLRTVLGKFFCCSLTLSSGVALGREGPSVQIGAGIASVLAQRLGLARDQIRALVPVGCAAALAAAFNTPIAAVLFSLEEIMGDLHAPVLGSVVLASATSWMVLHLILGDDPLFHVPSYQLVHPAEFAIYAVLGLIGGLVSVAFVKVLLHLRLLFRRLPKQSVWVQPAIGGLFVGLLGFFVPDVLGVGYAYVERVLNGDVVFQMVALLLILKLAATAVCYSSGNAGGIFGPSLFLGAMLGAATGSVAHTLFPHIAAGPGAYALIGMGTAFAGIIRTPLTSVIMIFELTRDYSIIVPLMISNLISYFISYKLQHEPIYEALAHQDGVHLPPPERKQPRDESSVASIMRPIPALPAPSDTLEQALRLAREAGLDLVPVLGPYGALGAVALSKLQAGGETLASAGLIEPAHFAPFPHLHPDHSQITALHRMSSAGFSTLPVVSRANVRELVGIVYSEDILHPSKLSAEDIE